MKPVKQTVALPQGVLPSDLRYPSYKDEGDARLVEDYARSQFELWLVATREGATEWFIPTLRIANASRRSPGTTARTYATRVKDGAGGYRIGRGPHVRSVVTVYVRRGSARRLEPFLAMRDKGEETANQIRDRISSRRAQGSLMRAQGRTSWRWDS